MSLTPGTRLGHYEILSALGAGGMGEVYRARDTKLNRDVAIKVLPESLAHDPERLARFSREAQVLAALNHPNIAHIHGFEDSTGVPALVMELVEGPTLADRIARRPIPIDEALPIAKQIAEALEAAHEQGIIHRDLKPANIKVREDGTVKVLDFGLARALDPTMSSGSVTMSPTLSVHATQAGIILGTAAYMSPEQARGKAVDKRADIWAFGVVVFEMITGRRPFDGKTTTDVIASVVAREPDWSALASPMSIGLRRLLARCLKKDPKERLQAIGDARIEIGDLLIGEGDEATTLARASAASRWLRALPWTVAGALGVGLAIVVQSWALRQKTQQPLPLRLSVEVGADLSIATESGAALALSPDGSLLALTARDTHGSQQLYVRRLGELQASPLAGTANGHNPFFSPDGQWIGFFADSKLKKVAVAGGGPVTLCDAGNDRGGAWAEDGSIVFQAGQTGGLSRVSSHGGAPAVQTALGTGEVTHRWPQSLPGGGLLYAANSDVNGFDDATIVVQPPNGAPKVVHHGGYYGRYLQSGHLTFVHHGTVFVEPFDLARLEPTGPPVPFLVGISANPNTSSGAGISGSAQVAWSETGAAVYLGSDAAGESAPIAWMDRAGRVTPLRSTPTKWGNLSFSPDGHRLAMDIDTGKEDVWVYDWVRDTPTRLTFDLTLDEKPVWTPDGQRIAFRSGRDRIPNLYWVRADGSGDVQRLTESPNAQMPGSWHPSGKFLAFWEVRPHTGQDLMILPLDGDEASGWKPGKPTVFLSTPAAELGAMFSPDGRWIAYQSSQSGAFQVYVRPFPGPGGMWQISTDGGQVPTWSRARQEILFLSPDQRLMVVPYTVEGETFKAEQPRVWSERRLMPRPRFRGYDLHPDGQRVAAAIAPESQSSTKQDKVVLVVNLSDELRRIAAVSRR